MIGTRNLSRRKRLTASATAVALVALALSGCSSLRTPNNREAVQLGLAYQAEYRSSKHILAGNSSLEINLEQCAFEKGEADGSAMGIANREQLNIGDLVKITVGSDEVFSGNYEVSQDGTLKLPHLRPIRALGATVGSVETAIEAGLVEAGLYAIAPRVSVLIADFAPARVFVNGAVFEPMAVTVGTVAGTDRDSVRQAALGGVAGSRTLSRALQSAGGVRPDADLSRVHINRAEKTITIDARAAIEGRPFPDLLLLEGDEVTVPSRGCFQQALVVPSSVTPPGVKVFMSNLTRPADSNSDSAIGKEARELRYGTRFIQAVVGMNCYGGAKLTNANRKAVLFSRNPITGESVVIERSIEKLLRREDRDELDPYIMPGDALACYDSAVVNIVDVATGLGIVAGTAALIGR